MKSPASLATLIVIATALGGAADPSPAGAGRPAPQVEYLYDVTIRRHYNFTDNDLLCPAQIWQLRNSAAHYRPPDDG